MQTGSFGSFIHAHPALSLLAAYMLFSNAVSALPSPAATSGKFYIWFFGFTQLTASSAGRLLAIRGIKVPNGQSNGDTAPKV